MPDPARWKPSSATAWALLVGLLGAQLLPIWWFASYPTQDGPPNLYIAHLLSSLSRPDATGIGDYFRADWKLAPNLTIYLLLQALLALFTPEVVEKLVVSAYVILLALAFLYAARPLKASPVLVVLLSLPLGLTFTLQLGLFGYSYSVLAFLLGLGIWLRSEALAVPSWRRHAVLGLIALLAVLTHIFGAAELLLVIGVACPVLAVLRSRATAKDAAAWRRAAYREAMSRVLPTGLVLLPTFLFILWFAAGQQPDPFYGPLPEVPLQTRIAALFISQFAIVQSKAFMALTLGLNVALSLALTARLRERSAAAEGSDLSVALGVAVLVLLLVYLGTPTQLSGSALVLDRHHPFLYAVFVLWLVSRPLRQPRDRLVMAAACLVALSLPALRGYQALRANEIGSDFAYAEQFLRPGQTMMTLDFGNLPLGDLWWHPTRRVYPFVHAGKRLAMRTGAIDLGLVQARHTPSVVPLAFTPGVSPYDAAFALRPPVSGFAHDIDVLAYQDATGQRVDILLIWGVPAAPYQSAAQHYLSRLEQQYDLIGLSPKGWMRVYRHKQQGDGRPAHAAFPPNGSSARRQ